MYTETKNKGMYFVCFDVYEFDVYEFDVYEFDVYMNLMYMNLMYMNLMYTKPISHISLANNLFMLRTSILSVSSKYIFSINDSIRTRTL